MTLVYVEVLNTSGQTVTLLLDDERDDETIQGLKKRARREELESVKVKKAPSAKRSVAEDPPPPPPVDPPAKP